MIYVISLPHIVKSLIVMNCKVYIKQLNFTIPISARVAVRLTSLLTKKCGGVMSMA